MSLLKENNSLKSLLEKLNSKPNKSVSCLFALSICVKSKKQLNNHLIETTDSLLNGKFSILTSIYLGLMKNKNVISKSLLCSKNILFKKRCIESIAELQYNVKIDVLTNVITQKSFIKKQFVVVKNHFNNG